MNIGVLTFTTDGDYFKLCNKFTDSVIKFSSLPVTVFTVGFTAISNGDRLTYQTLSEESNFDSWSTKCFYKHLACSLTPYDITIYVDTDVIVTPNFEKYFLTKIDLIKNSNTLLGVKHPHSPSSDINFPVRPYINQFFNIFGVEEIPDYLLTSVFAYNANFKSHFAKLFEKDKILVKQNILPVAGEEMPLNLYLHKNNLISNTDCGEDITPNYSEKFFESYINDTWLTCNKYIKDYKNFNRKVNPILWHGNKDVNYAQYMIDEISKKYSYSFLVYY